MYKLTLWYITSYSVPQIETVSNTFLVGICFSIILFGVRVRSMYTFPVVNQLHSLELVVRTDDRARAHSGAAKRSSWSFKPESIGEH